MRKIPSDLPSLFVLYMMTVQGEVIHINENGSLILPRYEFEARYGSEAITTAIGRQMEKEIGYYGMRGHINLADTGKHYAHESEELTLTATLTDDDDEMDDAEFEKMLNGIDPKRTPAELAMKNDYPFRVCVAYGCIPCEKDTKENVTAPFVLWARELFTYTPFPEWDADRRTQAAREKKIMRMPYAQWDAMIASGDITDRISVIATKIAEAWIAQVKPPSFPRKTKRENYTRKK